MDGRYAHCAREEHAGTLQPGRDNLYAHFLEGACRCGRSHEAPRVTREKPSNAKGLPTKHVVHRASEKRFEIRDVDGQVHAVHVRRDKPEGQKEFWWELPDGTRNLSGRRVETLPLYGSERLAGLADGADVVITEGEKACEALHTRGIATVGTITGAKVTPGDEALRRLLRLRPILWPDNDGDGLSHMERVATRLHALGTRARMVRWPEAPPKGDAADFTASDEELRALLKAAKPYDVPLTVNLGALLDKVRAFVSGYVAVDDNALTAVTLWVAHTWALDAADATPYLSITSAEKRSGKTRMLEVMACLVAKAWLTGRVTAAVLVRKMDRDAPTLLLDESDAAFQGEKEYAEALRGVLNAGHRRGGVASLCVRRGGDFDLRDFSVFGPKALAGIGRLPDTVADRAISIVMRRRAPGERVSRFRQGEAEAASISLRGELELWADHSAPLLRGARPSLPDELDDRAADGWEPLFAIADLAAGNWSQRARSAALSLSAGDGHEDESLGVRLLRDIKAVFEESRLERLPSAELATALQRIEESPWGDMRGKSLDARSLARHLKAFAIKPHPVRDGSKVFKGYALADFEDAFTRYLQGAVTNVSSVTDTSHELNPGGYAVTDVTDVTVNERSREIDSEGGGVYTNDPVACRDCAAVIPAAATLCANCGAKRSPLVRFGLEMGATELLVI